MLKLVASVGFVCATQAAAEVQGCGIDGQTCPHGAWTNYGSRRRRDSPGSCECQKASYGGPSWCDGPGGSDSGHEDCGTCDGPQGSAPCTCYWLPQLCDWGSKPKEVVGYWFPHDFLDEFSTRTYETMSESDLTEDVTHTVGISVTNEISKGFDVKVKVGPVEAGGTASAKQSISENWSATYHRQFTTKSTQDYTVTISDQDGQTAMKEGKGFLWTWQFNTTYNWNSISVITKTDTRAYTQDRGHFPRCYPTWGTDDTYQSCVEGGDLPEASMGSDAVV